MIDQAPPPADPGHPASDSRDGSYRVLARAYRPSSFDGLVGQETLIQTLSNAFATGRLAQAYMLSGVRGIGKTTTARIIARALNCVGPDGTGGPTATPCGVCDHCVAIAGDNHVDVLEIDAASHTGVDDMRELIDGARYRPSTARYKVYIIDEVHMLSKSAFNALLKTLEEPPEHVRFVFATTEIRKVPVTVLSRCQRFDLRRVDAATLATHLQRIADQEKASVDAEALHLIARAADGSVRDGLSLLDQAIAHAAGTVDAETVRGMLGLADRTLVFDILDAVMAGDAGTALGIVESQHASGADPVAIVGDLLDLVHWLTRIKVAANAASGAAVPEAERVRGRELAGRLGMAEVSRAWQLLLKGLGEVRMAPAPMQAVDMLLVRLAYAARLPTPADALRRLEGAAASPAGPVPPAPAPSPAPGGPPTLVPTYHADSPSSPAQGPSGSGSMGPMAARTDPVPADAPTAPPAPGMPRDFPAVVNLLASLGELELYGHIKSGARLVGFEPGRIELRLEEDVAADVPGRLSRVLTEATSRPWLVAVSSAEGDPTLLDQEAAAAAALKAETANDPRVRAILDAFPGAEVETVRLITPSEDGTSEGPGFDPDQETGEDL